MSLEQKIEQLTAALVALTEKTDALISIRTDAVETIKTAAAPAGKATKTTKNDAAATGKTETASTETTGAADAGTTAGGTDESVYVEAKKLVAAYTTGSDRPEEQQARKETVRTLLRHQKLVKPDLADPSKFSVTDVQEAMIPVLIKNLKAAIERGDITQPEAAGAGDDLL